MKQCLPMALPTLDRPHTEALRQKLGGNRLRYAAASSLVLLQPKLAGMWELCPAKASDAEEPSILCHYISCHQKEPTISEEQDKAEEQIWKSPNKQCQKSSIISMKPARTTP